MTSWEFFDALLEQARCGRYAGIRLRPGTGNYFRLTAFGSRENTVEAVERIRKM